MIIMAIILVSVLILAVLVISMCLVKVREGKAKLMMNPGENYARTIVNWKPYMVADQDYPKHGFNKGDIIKRSKDTAQKVKEKKSPRIPGTAFFFKWPWQKPFSYNVELSENHQMAKKGERLDYLDLKEQKLQSEIIRTTGAARIKKKKQESSFSKVDVTVSYLIIMRIKNPYEFIFDSPSNGYDAALDRLDNAMGQIISQCEENTLEQLEGDSEALWWGVVNPEVVKYDTTYPEVKGKDLEKLKINHRKIWERYKDHISYSEDIDILFSGIGHSKLVAEEFQKWGVKIIPQAIEITKVDPSEDFKEWREKIQQAAMKKEEMKQELGQEEIIAQMQKIKGEGKSNSYQVQMSLVNSIAASLAHSGYKKRDAIPLAKEILETLIAGEEGNLEKKIFKGLDGNNISAIAAQLELGRQMMTDKGGNKENKAGFKTGEEGKSEKEDEKEEKSFAFVDEEGNEKFTF